MNVGTLYELLDRLPERCDYFKVRFTRHDRTEWVQPECWKVDDGDLILSLWNDGEDHDDDEYTVDGLKDLLDGRWNDDCNEGQEIDNWREVFVERADGDLYNILRDRFEINWKRERVDEFIVCI